MSKVKRLKQDYFNQTPVKVAEDILGCYLVRKSKEGIVEGKIVETEAYYGEDDLACHASHGRTQRTETLYQEAGRLYVYLNYGIFYLTNIVCEKKDIPGAVLLRAVEITKGHEFAAKRIETNKFVKNNNFLATGPGKLSIAFDLSKEQNGFDVTGSESIYFEDRGEARDFKITKAKRVGVDYAQHCKDYLWRFYIKDNKFISKK